MQEQLVGRTDRVLPEKGVMLDADFPQPLGSSVVRKLKTNCAFKLLVLEGTEGREMYGKHEEIQNQWQRR